MINYFLVYDAPALPWAGVSLGYTLAGHLEPALLAGAGIAASLMWHLEPEGFERDVDVKEEEN